MMWYRAVTKLSMLAATAVVLLTIAAANPARADNPTPCTNPRSRREIRDLSDDERKRFFDALRGTQRRPAPDRPSPYDDMAYFHNGWSGFTHAQPIFLPYHRLFLDKIEKELQRIDPSVMLPYWDWSADAAAPDLSPILSPGWFGTNGRGPNRCVVDGFFNGFVPYFHPPEDKSNCVSRRYDNGNRIKPFAPVDVVAGIVGNSQDFETFRKKIEGFPHGRIHNGLGGSMGTMFSPNDPVFYMHHAFIDKIWYDWQKVDPAKRVYQFYGVDTRLKRDVDLNQYLPPPFDKRRVGDGMSVRSAGMCYTYAQPIKAFSKGGSAAPNASLRRNLPQSTDIHRRDAIQTDIPIAVISNITRPQKGFSPSDDRTYIMQLHSPPPLPAEWIRMNRLDEVTVRVDEQDAARVCDELNRVEGYVSPSALWNRPTLLARVLETEPVLHAYVNGRLVSVTNDLIGPGAGGRSPIEQINRIKSSFVRAGARVMANVRETASALRRIIGCGVDRLINRFDEGVAKIAEGAKKVANKAKTTLSKAKNTLSKAKNAIGKLFGENDTGAVPSSVLGSTGAVPCNTTSKGTVAVAPVATVPAIPAYKAPVAAVAPSSVPWVAKRDYGNVAQEQPTYSLE